MHRIQLQEGLATDLSIDKGLGVVGGVRAESRCPSVGEGACLEVVSFYGRRRWLPGMVGNLACRPLPHFSLSAAQQLAAADHTMCDQKRIVDGVLRNVGSVVFRCSYPGVHRW